jgi:hypothetical protein
VRLPPKPDNLFADFYHLKFIYANDDVMRVHQMAQKLVAQVGRVTPCAPRLTTQAFGDHGTARHHYDLPDK